MSKYTILTVVLLLTAGDLSAQSVMVRDLAPQTKFQGAFFGHLGRGRASIAADFDLDGFVDFYVGNPGDESYILRNIPKGTLRGFAFQQMIINDSLAWGGVAFDYDNDGDYDLFVACGANEGIGYDYLFRNDWIVGGQVTGNLVFVDVSDEAGIRGPIPNGQSAPIPTSSANAVAADYDRDGDVDIFVSGGIHTRSIQRYPYLIGRNTLWRNNDDGTFSDVTVAAGLYQPLLNSRNSSWIDYDNDGDPDLYENNFIGGNILWKNNGNGTFSDVTIEMSAPGDDLRSPMDTYGNAVADFNNDGWDDLFVAQNGREGGGSYADGHALFINLGGAGFQNVAHQTIINDDFIELSNVMGFQIGDVNGDGYPDIYLGHGTMPGGQKDEMFFSTGVGGVVPTFTNESALIDFPAMIPQGLPVPPFPYRTHGISFVDFDNDGTIEVSVVNGGPAAQPDTVREPNRLFKFRYSEPKGYLKVRVVGNGATVSRDAIGTRASVRLRNSSGESWTTRRVLLGGSAFSAQNGFELYFGLADADTILMLRIDWPDGSNSTIREGLHVNTSMVVQQGEAGDVALRRNSSGETEESLNTEPVTLSGSYPNPFNPATTIAYHLPRAADVRLDIFNVAGELVRVLQHGVQDAGSHSAVFEATGLPSGIYFYRLQAGEFVETRKSLLLK